MLRGTAQESSSPSKSKGANADAKGASSPAKGKGGSPAKAPGERSKLQPAANTRIWRGLMN